MLLEKIAKLLLYIQMKDDNMENMSEYDVRQLRLMHDSLISFEKQQIKLSSLVGTLEFLFHALERVSKEREKEFLEGITDLEIVNAHEIIKNAGEEIREIKKSEKEVRINRAVQNLKKLIELTIPLT